MLRPRTRLFLSTGPAQQLLVLLGAAMRVLSCLVMFAVLSPCSAAAQTTSDGIQRLCAATTPRPFAFERPQRSFPFCTDMIVNEGLHDAMWRAIGGTLLIAVGPRGTRVREPHLYEVTIRLVGAEFVSASGVRVRQKAPITFTALVGGFSG